LESIFPVQLLTCARADVAASNAAATAVAIPTCLRTLALASESGAPT
jgi:hypothetical protein